MFLAIEMRVLHEELLIRELAILAAQFGQDSIAMSTIGKAILVARASEEPKTTKED